MPIAPIAAGTPDETYRERLSARSNLLATLDLRRRRCGLLRLAVFAVAAAVVWLAVRDALPVWPIAAPVVVFIGLVWWQSRVEREMECARRAIAFYERGLARLEYRWHGGGETGERFIDPHHPYSVDLDIFGRGSLFELISSARTRGGEKKLADWLLSSADVAEVTERHEAVRELQPLLNLREQLAVLGGDFRVGVNPEHLAAWARLPAHAFAPALRWAAFVLSFPTAAALVWWVSTAFVGIGATRAVVGVGAVVGALGFSLRGGVLHIIESIQEPAHDLELLSQILELVERQSFHSTRLTALRAAIDTSGEPASRRIAHLRRLMEMLDSRDNYLVRIVGPPILWTTQTAMAIAAWHATNGGLISEWLDAIAELEALSSLANYAYEHPADTFPEFAEGGEPTFDAEDIGHPLLREDRSVRNTVRLVAPVRLLVVSGSNMSGKSTLLRAVGVNAVLAQAGGPVRARHMRISRLSLGASIRTMDSLEEGHSRFMAEIVRLKQILELPAPALFLLDELLHGTNSHDRAIGAEGVIRALLGRGAIGLATTHDLSLAKVADQLAPGAVNVHFEDRLEGGRLVFDYKMREGVVTRSNALDLMRAAGLDV